MTAIRNRGFEKWLEELLWSKATMRTEAPLLTHEQPKEKIASERQLWIQVAWIPWLASSLYIAVTLRKLLTLSMPQFHIYKIWIKHSDTV